MQQTGQFQYNDCIFCTDTHNDELLLMMNDALVTKHSDPSRKPTHCIDAILKIQSPACPQDAETCHFYHEFLVLDEHDEFMRREYAQSEYNGKMGMLAEYYKFHSDIPRVLQLGVEKIMGKYYDKKREYDYKRVKKVLKEEQGLSITSMQDSQSSFGDSQFEKRSRYSNLLNSIDKTGDGTISDSKILKDVCRQMQKAWPKGQSHGYFHIKGRFSEDLLFDQYVKQEQDKIKQKMREKNRVRAEPKVISKLNLKDLLKSREKSMERLESINTVKEGKPQPPKQKENKFVYNTNIKIQIRNAMFFSEGQNPTKIEAVEYDNLNTLDNRFKKKKITNGISSQYNSNQKLGTIADIYKPQHDLKSRLKTPTNFRLSTKEGTNTSHTRDKQRSLSKRTQLKTRAVSENKLSFNGNTWKRSDKSSNPVRSLSTSTIRKRPVASSKPVIGLRSSVRGVISEKKPIETISRYGSSDLKAANGNLYKNEKSVSIKQLLSRKLDLGRL